MSWIDDFIHDQEFRNITETPQPMCTCSITTDINKKYMMDLIPIIDQLLKVCNLRPGGINATAYDVGGVKKIVITFLEEE